MAAADIGFRSYPYATELRRELSHRNREYARQHNLTYRESYGQPPVICYLPSEAGDRHGNFLPETYSAIQKSENWRKRLEKVHAQSKSSLPKEDRCWRELDSSNSSDALLMNIFCYPCTLRTRGILDLLGVSGHEAPDFGVKARVSLRNERVDRTEVDIRLGDLLVEAKLTEPDFQSCDRKVVESYRDFHEVFDAKELPRDGSRYLPYQLIRNVLAAHATGLSFCVMADSRRPDLKEAWYAVMRTIRATELRVRCKMITWQELSEALPRKLRIFLAEKYGIACGDMHLTLPAESMEGAE